MGPKLTKPTMYLDNNDKLYLKKICKRWNYEEDYEKIKFDGSLEDIEYCLLLVKCIYNTDKLKTYEYNELCHLYLKLEYIVKNYKSIIKIQGWYKKITKA